MEKPIIFIVVRGGMIQHICATQQMGVHIIDYDCEEPLYVESSPDEILSYKEIFKKMRDE